METILVKVYSYNELSEKAQIKAKNDWIDSDPTKGLINYSWALFVDNLKSLGIELNSWNFEYLNHEVSLKRTGTFLESHILYQAALRKVLSIYHEIVFCPKIYRFNDKKRISKIQMVEDEDLDDITKEFASELKETIRRGDYRRSLYFCINTAVQRAAQFVQKEYNFLIDMFPEWAARFKYRFFADGSRYYNDGGFFNE